MIDNEPLEARAALLIAVAPHPATQADVFFDLAKELSEEDDDPYADAWIACAPYAGRAARKNVVALD